MIKFFRKIRQKLLSENKFSKYLLYAIGEILLVVIGILIALQINNSNENRKERKKEKTFLIRLQKDIAADTLYFNNRLEFIKSQKELIYKFIHELYNTQNTVAEFKDLLQMESLYSGSLVVQNSTYEELKSAGLINIIQNEQLKIDMIELYREYRIASEHFNEINNFTSREIFSKSVHIGIKYYISDLYDEERLFRGSDWTYINDPSSEYFKLLENTQANYYLKYDRFLGRYESLLSKSKALLRLVEKELDKNKR